VAVILENGIIEIDDAVGSDICHAGKLLEFL
jgi:hypothetical protein